MKHPSVERPAQVTEAAFRKLWAKRGWERFDPGAKPAELEPPPKRRGGRKPKPAVAETVGAEAEWVIVDTPVSLAAETVMSATVDIVEPIEQKEEEG